MSDQAGAATRIRRSVRSRARCCILAFLSCGALAAGAAGARSGPAPPAGEAARQAAAAPLHASGVAREDSFPPWRGRHDALETALRLGEIVERERLGTGITNPWKVVVEHRGERLAAVWKPLADNPNAMHRESWRAEVAAYRLSRYLGLDNVPPTVPRAFDRQEGSLQLWVDGCRVYGDVPGDAARPGYRWLHQIDRMRLFDAFLDNADRNKGNFLVDGEWNVVLIDHSRALPLRMRPRELPPLPSRIDAGLLERLRALDAEEMRLLLGDLYSKLELGSMLRHRDRVVRTVERHLSRGKAALFGEEGAMPPAAARDGA
jgi:hypothetical protein